MRLKHPSWWAQLFKHSFTQVMIHVWIYVRYATEYLSIPDSGGIIRLREETRSVRAKALANEYSTQRIHIRGLHLHTAMKVFFF
jgi:hypothetical protein